MGVSVLSSVVFPAKNPVLIHLNKFRKILPPARFITPGAEFQGDWQPGNRIIGSFKQTRVAALAFLLNKFLDGY
ncbi:MAG: hypothetical protein FJY21_12135 [Bacteroidetes bacterium]|nr:hypothetical protein [Bacteroidota bacterium]